MVVVENNPDLVPVMDKDKILYVFGNASQEEVILRAGIQKAKGLIAALATDVDNVFIVLTARQLAPELKIIARASTSESASKLKAAGANYVESPYEMGARNMAQRILRPTVTNFIDLAFTHKRKDIQMEEIPVSALSELANVMLKDSGIRQRFNLIIIAMKKPDGTMTFNPSFEAVMTPGETPMPFLISMARADFRPFSRR